MNTRGDIANQIAIGSVGLSALTGSFTYFNKMKKAKDIVKNHPVTLAGYKHVKLDINHCPPVDEFIKSSKKASLKSAAKNSAIILLIGGCITLAASIIKMKKDIENLTSKSKTD